MDSIIQEEKECFMCGCKNNLECHHIFGGNPNRKLSEKYGLKVYLCHEHHNEPPNGVHFNKKIREYLQRIAQTAFETYYPQLDFVGVFGKNYR